MLLCSSIKAFKRTALGVLCVCLGLSLSANAAPALPKTGGKVSVDFHDVDIKDVIKAMSEITGKNFIMDDKVRGRVTVVSPKPVSIEEAYQAFLSALEMNNFTTVEVGKFTKIVSARDRGKPIPFITGDSTGYGDQLITKVIQLKYIQAAEVNRTVRRMVSSNGTSNAYSNTNSLIVTDTASNIARIEQMVAELDNQKLVIKPEFIPLKHTQADAIAKMLQGMFKAKKGEDGDSGSDIQDIIPDERTNSIIVLASQNGLGRILDALGELDKPVEPGAQKGRVHFVKLKHANADEIAGTLSNLFSGKSSSGPRSSSGSSSDTSSSGGSGSSASKSSRSTGSSTASVQGGDIFDGAVTVVSDPTTNSLIVTASPKDYEQLKPIIAELDKRRAQVYVEALIMEVNMNKATEVAVSAHGAGAAAGLGLFAAQNKALSAFAMNDVKALGSLVAGGGMVLGAAGQSFNFPGTSIALPFSGGIFKALQNNNIINVLSAPNILTVDNKKAEITVGQKINFPKAQQAAAGGGALINNYEREMVGLTLSVTPQINDGDEVTMEVEQKIQEATPSEYKDAGPNTNERLAKTTVISKSGQTVVIGGLISETDTKTVSKVPVLGDVPLLGYLFRDTKKDVRKVNLMIFLTPSVVRDPNDMTRVSVAKNSQRRAFNRKNGIAESSGLRDYELDKGLNLAAPASVDAADTKPKKRFDYASEPLAGEASTPETSGSDRVQKDTRDSVERASHTGSPRKSRGVNPFAEIRPPSSEN